MTTAWALTLLVLVALFTPTWVVLWQLWTSRLSGQRRSLPPRPVFVPGPRLPS